MSILIDAVAVTVPSALALVGAGAAWYLRGNLQAERRRSDRLHQQNRTFDGQRRATELLLAQTAAEVVPALHRAVVGRSAAAPVGFVVPDALAGSLVADRMRDVVDSVARTLRQLQHEADQVTGAQVAEVRQAADRAVSAVRQEEQDATAAAVRSLAAAQVMAGSRASRLISDGVRGHAGQEVYATLVAIDRQLQRFLLDAQSHIVLGGGKLSRRWPATSLTDVVHAAMGHLEGFERIKSEESELAVVSRVVGPLIHTLAVLLDNALRYSPASAVVEVRLLEGHHGLTVRIDDAGLQMSPEAQVAARRVLVGGQPHSLSSMGAHPQTGFVVAGRLAREYGFSVEVDAPNSYRGTTVQVFLPRALLTTVPVTGPAPAVVPQHVPGEPERTANGLAVRRRGTPSEPRPAAATVAALPGRSDVAAAWAAGTRSARTNSTSGEGA
ncbi:ATP-binding protein [Streptomyces sp. 5.8]|uniref:ATP-binding protein n=1 Tax=Streptomyces sp. 5.8 TaxID=3406571 RepID=UPI003BB6CC8B